MARRARNPAGSVTIIDVARAAGVSVSTVSRVIRNHVDVNEDTRMRVREVIRATGYRPSAIARALASGRSQTIALLVSDIANPFYPQLAKSIEQEARKHGYALVICNTEDSDSETEQYVERLLGDGIQGVIHASVGTDEQRTLEQLGDDAQIVFTNRRPRSPACSYVVSDSYAGTAELTRHLYELGHRRIGFVKGPDFASNTEERLRGFLETAEELKIKPLVADGDFSPKSGASAVARWLKGRSRPSAVIGVNDLVALGVWDALLEAGLRVPEDVAVAGFDDIQLAGSRLIGLTSVAQHIEEMASRAVHMLVRMTSGEHNGHPEHEILKPQLIVRRSTAGSAPASSGQ